MTPSRIVIKLGGASLQDEAVLSVFAGAIRQYRRFGFEVIVVHGGGPAINAELTRLGIIWSFLHGQRVTTPEMMKVVEKVLVDQVNSSLVDVLKSHGLAVQGLSGADGRILFCTPISEELGLVGLIREVSVQKIEEVLSRPDSPIPVVAPIGVGVQDERYNINADWAASRLAVELKAKYLIFLTDQSGILNGEGKTIRTISVPHLKELVENGVVTQGMLTKTRTILSALENGVNAVRVMNGLETLNGLWSDSIGTWCLPADVCLPSGVCLPTEVSVPAEARPAYV